MKQIKWIVMIILGFLFLFISVFGLSCGTTCKGFCKCHGIPFGNDRCIGIKTYGCCVDCFYPELRINYNGTTFWDPTENILQIEMLRNGFEEEVEHFILVSGEEEFLTTGDNHGNKIVITLNSSGKNLDDFIYVYSVQNREIRVQIGVINLDSINVRKEVPYSE